MSFETTTLTAPATRVDIYLGFEIAREADDFFVAFPKGWGNRGRLGLGATSLPALRTRIWRWWHPLAS